MATWDQLKDVVKQNLKVKSDEGNLIVLTFEFDDKNDQDVVVSLAGNDKIGEWAQVESAFGTMEDVDIEAAVRKSEEILCGGVACSGDYITLRHSVPLAQLDAEEILIPIQAIVSSASDFSAEFADAEDEDDEDEEEEEKE